MIDNKKIEDAAIEAADLYEQDLPMMSYNEDTEVDGQHHFCQEFGAELFKEGAKWAINEFLKDLWHPISEEPKESIFMLSEYEKGKYYAQYFDKNRGGWRNKRLIRWLNIDDLFPKKE